MVRYDTNGLHSRQAPWERFALHIRDICMQRSRAGKPLGWQRQAQEGEEETRRIRFRIRRLAFVRWLEGLSKAGNYLYS